MQRAAAYLRNSGSDDCAFAAVAESQAVAVAAQRHQSGWRMRRSRGSSGQELCSISGGTVSKLGQLHGHDRWLAPSPVRRRPTNFSIRQRAGFASGLKVGLAGRSLPSSGKTATLLKHPHIAAHAT